MSASPAGLFKHRREFMRSSRNNPRLIGKFTKIFLHEKESKKIKAGSEMLPKCLKTVVADDEMYFASFANYIYFHVSF